MILLFFSYRFHKDHENNVLVKLEMSILGWGWHLASGSWFSLSQFPPEMDNKWKTLMPWKLTLIDTLLPKPAKNFPHSKTNGAKRRITVMIYNDTHFATLERTSSLARRMIKEASFFSPQAAIWCRNLGSTCNRVQEPCLYCTHVYFENQNKTELFVFVAFFFPTQTHTSFIFQNLTKTFLENNRGDW